MEIQKATTCARIERWSLRLIPYNFKIHHIPGITNIADYISRHAVQEIQKGQDYVEEYVNSIVDYNLSLSVKLEALIQATQEDEDLNNVKKILQTDKCHDDKLRAYYNIRSELSTTNDGLILYGSRIVIPYSLQNEIISVAHQGHQGKEKTKKLLKQYVWFPQMNVKAEKFIDKCHVCNVNSEKTQYEPLAMSPLPNGVWEELATDFHGPLPSG